MRGAVATNRQRRISEMRIINIRNMLEITQFLSLDSSSTNI